MHDWYQFCIEEQYYSMCNTYYAQTTDAIKEWDEMKDLWTERAKLIQEIAQN